MSNCWEPGAAGLRQCFASLWQLSAPRLASRTMGELATPLLFGVSERQKPVLGRKLTR